MEPRQPITEEKVQPVNSELAQKITRELEALPPQYVSEVARFIEYLRYRAEERADTEDFFRLSAEVWDND